jgi:hypothetical protein
MSIDSDETRARATVRLLSAPGLAMDDALIAVAECFAGCDRAQVLATLDDASRPLFGGASLPPSASANALGSLLATELRLRPAPADPDALLVDRALDCGAAHPVVIAAVGHEIARRAGVAARVCRAREDWWLAVPGEQGLALVDCSGGRARPEHGPLRALCAHQVALALLRAVEERGGPATWRGRAAWLTGQLACDRAT